MAIKTIKTDKCVPPIGPYSQALAANGTVYLAGQLGLDVNGQLVQGGIAAQTRQALTNIQNVLAEAGCTMDDVVSTCVYMTDLGEFPTMNAVYGEFFTKNPPARTTVGAAALPKGGAVEIACVAVVPACKGC
jgi:2-iminobutanoate/2-iminopropanoate deaminase